METLFLRYADSEITDHPIEWLTHGKTASLS